MIEIVEREFPENPEGLPAEIQEQAKACVRKDPVMLAVMAVCPFIANIVEHGVVTEFTKL